MKDYAWELLQCEAQLQVTKDLGGTDIANLLSLYMRAVERLNSIHDSREAFFKNRVTTLMMRPNVVKSLSSPVKQITVKTPVRSNKLSPVGQTSKQCEDKRSVLTALQLERKKKEIELQLAYQAEEHTTDQLAKLISQHNSKAQTLNTRIENAINDNSRRIQQRIKRRQMKSVTAKSTYETPPGATKEVNKLVPKYIEIIKEEIVEIISKPLRKKSLDIVKSQPQESEVKQRRGSMLILPANDLLGIYS